MVVGRRSLESPLGVRAHGGALWVVHAPEGSPHPPLALRRWGEAGVIPSAAVFASAIEDAEGFPIRSMPISPAELWELRQQHTTTTDPVPAQEGSR